ncbi:14846_t:CDS:2 [Racocetra fulgida]|uniref:14846_t:CDS:1 n=1 Tax=Racocetra fulgida TaxID=60492 RepID=A0A9N8VWL5_9GLOM|nr:14846_t:CDS:2 [Racocetra fulgida]
MLKQAMNTVESKFDKALDIGESMCLVSRPQSIAPVISDICLNADLSTIGNLQDSESKELRTILDNIIEQSKSSKNELETESLTSVHTNSVISISSDAQSREFDGIDSSRTSNDSRASEVESQLTTDNFQHIIEQREHDNFSFVQIRELRATLVRVEEQAGLREDNLRNEILALQQRLQIAENYARDSTSEEWEIDRIQLLKQIEDVKTQYALSVKKLELIAAQQKNSQLSEEIESLNARIPTLQSEIETLTSNLESSEECHQKSLKEIEEQYRCILRQTLEEKQDEWEERLRSEQEVKSKEREQEKLSVKVDSIRGSPIRSASETQLSSLRSVSEIHLEKHTEGGVQSPMLKSPTSSLRSNELADELVKLTTQIEDLYV